MRFVRRTVRASLLALALTLPVATYAGTAHASDAAAAEAFKAGANAYQKNDYRGAAAAFERAYKESPRAAAIYNAGLAWEAAGEGARAADAYAMALDAGDLGGQQKKDAQTRVGNLAKMLGRLEVTGPAGATISVAHRESATLPAKIYLTAGPHDVTARFDGGATSKQSVTVAAGATAPLALDAPKKDAPPPPPPPVVAKAEPREPVPPPAPGMSGVKVAGFVALGGAVVASGAAIFFGVSAVSAKSDFDDSGHRDQNAHDRADELRTLTNVAWVAAGVMAATGVVLVLVAPKSKPGASSSASLGFGAGGGTLSVRF